MGLSVVLAETVSTWANRALVASLIVGVVATYAIVISGNVKETALKSTISSADAAAAKAQAEAAKANERAESLHKANLETQTRLVAAERDLEAERTERLNLEASIAPRTLTPQQSEKLTAALKAAPQPLNVRLNLIEDEEANKYGHFILAALAAAKVNGRADSIGMMVPPPYGLTIMLKDNDPQAVAIQKAFEAAKIPARFLTGGTDGFDATILVGLRPLGPNR